jgi:hypothetical protein
MKLRVVVIFSMAIALPAFAHDPSMHKGGDAKTPDCEQMEKMDMGKMDKNDPVMKAMRAKCMAAMAGDHGGHDVKPADKAAVKPATPEMAMPPMQQTASD